MFFFLLVFWTSLNFLESFQIEFFSLKVFKLLRNINLISHYGIIETDFRATLKAVMYRIKSINLKSFFSLSFFCCIKKPLKKSFSSSQRIYFPVDSWNVIFSFFLSHFNVQKEPKGSLVFLHNRHPQSQFLSKDLVSGLKMASLFDISFQFLWVRFKMQQMEQLSNEKKRSKFTNSFEAWVCLRFSPFECKNSSLYWHYTSSFFKSK